MKCQEEQCLLLFLFAKKLCLQEIKLKKIFNDPSKVIYSIKRIIGKTYNEKDLKVLIDNLAYKDKLFHDKENKIFLKIERNGKIEYYSPKEISI